jgi:uncharacterized protein with GYD domain
MKCIYLINYAASGMKGLMQGSDREAAARALVDSQGGKLINFMFTRGKYDAAVTVDVPNQAGSLGVAMLLRASGAFSDVVVLEEVDLKAITAAAQKASTNYKPPG